MQAEEATTPEERFLLKLTIGKSMREKIRHAQALLSHAVPSGDVAQVLDRALDALIVNLEKRKLGAGTSAFARSAIGADAAGRPPVRNRYVPARIRRAVWERDQGQCTFVSAAAHRCESRRFLEFDHIDPVARGGRATVDGVRLRCRAHNQYEAERTFGAGFMSQKRHHARLAAVEARAWAARNMPRGMLEVAPAKDQTTPDQVQDVLAGLRNLGCRADEARRAAAFTGTLQIATLEERMRAALTFLSRR